MQVSILRCCTVNCVGNRNNMVMQTVQQVHVELGKSSLLLPIQKTLDTSSTLRLMFAVHDRNKKNQIRIT